jgi:transcriptional regulator with XRE-family HTH domain
VSTLGERLSAMRERRGLTQGEVARRIRLPQQAVSRLERGERQHVRSDVLARLSVALDVSADVLLGLRDLPTSEAALDALQPETTSQTAAPPIKRRRSRKAAPVA